MNSEKCNRLVNEPSPYLRQHANNPVEWYPWGDEAFETAKLQDKPVFLSIGYSTCHWCHVMERESFENEQIAGILNDAFVCIKVDREERPDIDSVYMQVCQMMTGSGGWPLTVIMTPDKLPFFTGTYFPPVSRYGRHGLVEISEKVHELWTTKKEMILTSANDIAGRLQNLVKPIVNGAATASLFDMAFKELSFSYDKVFGGFGSAPKFPIPHHLSFLLRYWKNNNSYEALCIVTETLTKMRAGGIFDQLGYGFHRYSTDAKWLAPHFEKMLYDQAQLINVYKDTYLITGNRFYKDTACETSDYVLRELTSPDGAFYCAEDADSEGVEGKFYVWSAKEIVGLISDYDFAAKAFGISQSGNFSEGYDLAEGKNILTSAMSVSELALEYSIAESHASDLLDEIRKTLLNERSKRIKPHLDDKVLTDWNGLMIGAFAAEARAFGIKKYEDAALKAADFIINNLFDSNSRLLHRWREGIAGIDAMLDDYAFFVYGLLELYQTVFDTKYLKLAIALTEIQIAEFWDKNNGGFFATSENAELLIVRNKDIYDGALPSGNSVSLGNLLTLGRLTGNISYSEYADKLINAFSGTIHRSPSGHTQFLCSFDSAMYSQAELVIVGDRNEPDTIALLNVVQSAYQPNLAVILKSDGDPALELNEIIPFIQPMTKLNGKATAYFCKNYSCSQPVTEPEELKKLLNVVN